MRLKELILFTEQLERTTGNADRNNLKVNFSLAGSPMTLAQIWHERIDDIEVNQPVAQRTNKNNVDISYNIKLDSVCFPFCFAWGAGGVKHNNVQPNKKK